MKNLLPPLIPSHPTPLLRPLPIPFPESPFPEQGDMKTPGAFQKPGNSINTRIQPREKREKKKTSHFRPPQVFPHPINCLNRSSLLNISPLFRSLSPHLPSQTQSHIPTTLSFSPATSAPARNVVGTGLFVCVGGICGIWKTDS